MTHWMSGALIVLLLTRSSFACRRIESAPAAAGISTRRKGQRSAGPRIPDLRPIHCSALPTESLRTRIRWSRSKVVVTTRFGAARAHVRRSTASCQGIHVEW